MPTTPDVSRLSDHQLLAGAKELARRERHLNLQIIEHLNEIGRRGLHLRHGYGSLFDYAVKELGFAEGSAYQRLQTLKLSNEFPEVKQDLRNGELTLTAAGYLQSLFDRDQRRQRHWAREQRQSGARQMNDTHGAGGAPGANGSSGRAGSHRTDGSSRAGGGGGTAGTVQPGAAQRTRATEPGPTLSAAAKQELIARARGKSTRQVRELIAEFDPELARPRDRLRALGREQWELKAVIDGECRRGLEQLRHWLSHVNPAMDYGELLQRLVADAVTKYDPARKPARKQRQASRHTERRRRETGVADAAFVPPRTRQELARTGQMRVAQGDGNQVDATTFAQKRDGRGGRQDARAAFSQKDGGLAASDGLVASDRLPAAGGAVAGGRSPGARTRAIPAAVRRHIWLRDRGRCTYRDPESGRCCGSRHLVQIDHIQPYAVGGLSCVENLRLLCSAHNRARVADQKGGSG